MKWERLDQDGIYYFIVCVLQCAIQVGIREHSFIIIGRKRLCLSLLRFPVDVDNSNGRCGDMHIQIDQVCWITDTS